MDHHDLKNFELLKTIIKENDVIVDVGANKGTYTNFFHTKINGNGKLYSIEMDSQLSNDLKIKYSNDKNVIIVNKAISDINGNIPFYKGNNHTLNNILGFDTSYRKTEMDGYIESIRLDELLKNESNIKLIKIDVEGAELKVLDGLKNIVDKVKNILVECHFQTDWDNIKHKLLNEYNFNCVNCSCDVEGLEKIDENSKMAYQCFCTKKNG